MDLHDLLKGLGGMAVVGVGGKDSACNCTRCKMERGEMKWEPYGALPALVAFRHEQLLNKADELLGKRREIEEAIRALDKERDEIWEEIKGVTGAPEGKDLHVEAGVLYTAEEVKKEGSNG